MKKLSFIKLENFVTYAIKRFTNYNKKAGGRC